MYVMICTRLAILQAIRVVGRFMADLGKEHWNVVMRILRYIKGTWCVALGVGRSQLIVKGYVDSNFASDHDKRKSITRYVVTSARGEVSWLSKLKTIIALSLTEAGNMEATKACKKFF